MCLLLATGDGEKLMQFSPSFQVVQLMRQGCTPQEACDTVLKNIIAIKGSWFEAALIAIDCKVGIVLCINKY